MGFYPKEIKVYKMVKEEKGKIDVFLPLLKKITDFVFTSPKLFNTFLEFFGREILKNKNIIPIGKVTGEYIKERGFDIKIIPEEFTGKGILKAILKEV